MSGHLQVRGQRYHREGRDWVAECEWVDMKVTDEYHAATLDALEAANSRLAAIDAFHMPSIGMAQTCCYCISSWPCTTHLILHPKEGQ